MRKTIVVFIAVLATVLGGVTTAEGEPVATAGPRSPAVSGCGGWAGYVTNGGTYHSVGAVWQVPSIPASHSPEWVAFWVGLGGFNNFSGLEQIGISDVIQKGNPKPQYVAWWEDLPWTDQLVGQITGKVPPPDLPHSTNWPVAPGDFITATVTLTGKTYYLAMSDRRGTNHTIWKMDVPVAAKYGLNHDSAEVVLENNGPMPNFKRVLFDGAYVDGKPIGATSPTKKLCANANVVDVHPIGANGDNFAITTPAPKPKPTPTSTPAPASTPQVPTITSVSTYTEGVDVYFDIQYADPGNDAEGFGFVGVNGSSWAEETHPFSSPSYGIVGPDSIAYPFNEGCGTAQQYDSYVKAWIYDTAGQQSAPVVIHLVCAESGSAG
jgi:hypothetical protein